MKKLMLIFSLSLITNCSFAEDQSVAVSQGAQEYDWQTCVDNASNDCLNACTTSEEINCQDDCKTLAQDKCSSEGLEPPAF